jgi:hypothetical protein
MERWTPSSLSRCQVMLTEREVAKLCPTLAWAVEFRPPDGGDQARPWRSGRRAVMP